MTQLFWTGAGVAAALAVLVAALYLSATIPDDEDDE